jgi:hypothetical protein
MIQTLFVLILGMLGACFALTDITVPNTFVDSAVIEANDFNQNFDTLEAWSARLNDTLDAKFMRHTAFKHGTFGVKITTSDATVEQTMTLTYTVIDSMVMISIPWQGTLYGGLICTSNSTFLRIYPTSTFPSDIAPCWDRGNMFVIPCIVYNNGKNFSGMIHWSADQNKWTVSTLQDGAGSAVTGIDMGNGSFKDSGVKGLIMQTLVYRR